ncbi:uncharacterized protein BJX67DRAFT_302749 [Aspergillus lucknowensis]|uniref:Uncharacterized protein n=1 Tax=Aspergillus lucknowensis TaxID=176173 RepID=A0ABR4LZM3_9EURO
MTDKRHPQNKDEEEEYFYSAPSSPGSPQSPELPNGLPTKELMDRMLEYSQQSHIPLGRFNIEQSEQKQVERELPEEGQLERCEMNLPKPEPQADSPDAVPERRYTFIHQFINGQQQLEERIEQTSLRLNETLQQIQDRTDRIDAHFRDFHGEDRHRRLRARRQQRQRHQAQRDRHEQEDEIRTSLLSNATQNSRIKLHPEFENTLAHLSRRLHPLVSYTTGLTHPFFPKTILSYNLLTSDQLDSLAIHFHQVYPPKPETFRYPLPVKPWIATNGLIRDLGVDTEVKRKRFGRFIGLRGCESPTFQYSRPSNGRSIREQVELEWEKAFARAKLEEEERDIDLM